MKTFFLPNDLKNAFKNELKLFCESLRPPP
jgi:hypothetical protein